MTAAKGRRMEEENSFKRRELGSKEQNRRGTVLRGKSKEVKKRNQEPVG